MTPSVVYGLFPVQSMDMRMTNMMKAALVRELCKRHCKGLCLNFCDAYFGHSFQRDLASRRI
jgi:hypothetical protein